jgi:hypothetical protein
MAVLSKQIGPDKPDYMPVLLVTDIEILNARLESAVQAGRVIDSSSMFAGTHPLS